MLISLSQVGQLNRNCTSMFNSVSEILRKICNEGSVNCISFNASKPTRREVESFKIVYRFFLTSTLLTLTSYEKHAILAIDLPDSVDLTINDQHFTAILPSLHHRCNIWCAYFQTNLSPLFHHLPLLLAQQNVKPIFSVNKKSSFLLTRSFKSKKAIL